MPKDPSDLREEALLERIDEIYGEALKTAIRQNRRFLVKVNKVINGEIKPPQYYVDRGEEEKWRAGYIQELIRQYTVIDGIMKELDGAGVEVSAEIRDAMADIYGINRGEALSIFEAAGEDVQTSFSMPTKQTVLATLTQNEPYFSRLAYQHLGQNLSVRRRLQNELAQATILGESQQKLIKRIKAVTGQATYQARRVAQTERTRVQSQARYEAGQEAQTLGVRVANQWSTKMHNSRDAHVERNGKWAMQGDTFPGSNMRYPGDPAGGAAEVINCHCVLVPDVLWDDEIITADGRRVKDPNAKTGQAEQKPNVSPEMQKIIDELDSAGVEYVQVKKLANARTEDEIIAAIAGGDKTTGSCASAALAYVGQKCGFDVLDFRGGKSMKFFSGKTNKLRVFRALGVKIMEETSAKTNLTNGKRILARMEKGKEYYLSVGRHAAIVRLNDVGLMQYLELQSNGGYGYNNGWHNFNLADEGRTLKSRFRCSPKGCSNPINAAAYLTDIADFAQSDAFAEVLAYINTNNDKQKKGEGGIVR